METGVVDAGGASIARVVQDASAVEFEVRLMCQLWMSVHSRTMLDLHFDRTGMQVFFEHSGVRDLAPVQH